MNSDIQKRVFELAAEEANMPVEQVMREHHFENDLNFDSLAKVEFAMKVEDEFELSVPDEDLDLFKTVGDVIDYIEAKFAEPRPANSASA